MKKEKANIFLFYPVYNDEKTVRRITEKAVRTLSEVSNKYKILIVNDGSPDRSGEIADELAKEYKEVSVIHHKKNLGYGKALQAGFNYACDYEWVCFYRWG